MQFEHHIIFYQTATDRQVPCPVGTYNPDLNGDSLAVCLPCIAGFYCHEQTITPTLKCDQGYYCPTNITDGVSDLNIGSYGKQQVPCPRATYTDVIGTPNVTSCKACPVGSYCPAGTPNPIPCPMGYYCPPDSYTPAPCPIGTYGPSENLHYSENCTQCDKGKYVLEYYHF